MKKNMGGVAMPNMFDYIKWRGDLSFSEKRPNEIDSIIFSMLVCIDLGKVCGGEELTFASAAENYCTDGNYGSVNLGLIMPSENINRMFCESAKTKRYGNIKITDYDARTSDEECYQFAAVTFHMPAKQMMVIFRGTDDSIAGWREDCRLSFLDEIPAQRFAVEYLEMIAAKYPDEKIYITGHSKGGNLAIYSAVNCSDEIKPRIARAFCHDGPGLSYSMVNSTKYRAMQRKLSIFIPQSSYIGTMFEKGEKYTVINSTGRGLLQHDPYTWMLDGPKFERLPELSEKGKKNEEQFRARMRKMTADEKEEVVETLFSIVASTGAKTLTDFADGGVKRLTALVKGYSGLDKDKRELIVTILKKFFDYKSIK